MSIGGLRNPFRSVELFPKWRDVGYKLWRILEAYKHTPRHEDLVPKIGAREEDTREDQVRMLRKALARCHEMDEEPPPRGIWSEFLTVLVDKAGDPDREVTRWPRVGTPLGIVEDIPVGGVFPLLPEGQSKMEEDRLAAIEELYGSDGNYITYEEICLNASLKSRLIIVTSSPGCLYSSRVKRSSAKSLSLGSTNLSFTLIVSLTPLLLRS